MASVHCGQAALVPLPQINGRPKGGPATVTQYGLPRTLQVERRALTLGTAGIEVLKVSKVCYCTTVMYCSVRIIHIWTMVSHKPTSIYPIFPQTKYYKTNQNKI
jgi:hypothetical protein